MGYNETPMPLDVKSQLVNCNPDGTSTFHFSVSGLAGGSYPGTFTEVGTVVIGVQDRPYALQRQGDIVSFESDFTITSGDTVITGHKTADHVANQTPGVSHVATCVKDVSLLYGQGTILVLDQIFVRAQVLYEATISTPQGRFRETGKSEAVLEYRRYVEMYDGVNTDREESLFYEWFRHSNGVELIRLPTTAADCKKGAWQAYGVFKNQGDCVSFVATHGKNPPAGS